LSPRAALLLVLCFLLPGRPAAVRAQEAANPFFGSSAAEPSLRAPERSSAESRQGGLSAVLGRWRARAAALQEAFTAGVARRMREARTGGRIGPLLALLLISFAYGFLHALGPGHGKTAVFSYFLSTRSPILHAVAAGLGIGLLHVGVVSALVLAGYFLLRVTMSALVADATALLRRVCAVLLMAAGAILLARRLHPGHRHHDHPDPIRKAGSAASLLSLVLGAGLVPCSGAVLMLLFSLSIDSLGLGLLAVGSLSLGMGLTQSGIGLLTVLGKQRLLNRLQGSRPGRWAYAALELTAPALVIVLGLLLLL
jgi:ABC-type nickel/cobalt efflux system permease component RcnA